MLTLVFRREERRKEEAERKNRIFPAKYLTSILFSFRVSI
jgi:hypothetical protein